VAVAVRLVRQRGAPTTVRGDREAATAGRRRPVAEPGRRPRRPRAEPVPDHLQGEGGGRRRKWPRFGVARSGQVREVRAGERDGHRAAAAGPRRQGRQSARGGLCAALSVPQRRCGRRSGRADGRRDHAGRRGRRLAIGRRTAVGRVPRGRPEMGVRHPGTGDVPEEVRGRRARHPDGPHARARRTLSHPSAVGHDGPPPRGRGRRGSRERC